MNRIGTLLHLDRGPPALKVLLLSCAERAELQRQGAKAAARGEASDTNPLSQPRNRLAATCESADYWLQRSIAWEQGHVNQTAARRKVQPTALEGNADEQV